MFSAHEYAAGERGTVKTITIGTITNVLQVSDFNEATIMNRAYGIKLEAGESFISSSWEKIISLSLSLGKKRKLRCLRWVHRKLEGARPSWSSYQLVKMQIVLFCLAAPIDSARRR